MTRTMSHRDKQRETAMTLHRYFQELARQFRNAADHGWKPSQVFEDMMEVIDDNTIGMDQDGHKAQVLGALFNMLDEHRENFDVVADD